MERDERIELGKSRIIKILKKAVVANWRTLEQKISDAGPPRMRVNPHLLTKSKAELLQEEKLKSHKAADVDWHYLHDTSQRHLSKRLTELTPIQEKIAHSDTAKRTGQTLEIAFFLAAKDTQGLVLYGGFPSLEERIGRSRLFHKEEPPSMINGRAIPGKKKLDFLVHHPQAGHAGIELKNIREWFYPHRSEIKELLSKCLALDAVPILIARRIHFSTFSVWSKCGVVIHQTYNQLYDDVDREMAEKAKHKNLLGYHDIRVGFDPDERMKKFVQRDLPRILPSMREQFEQYKDLLEGYVSGDYSYKVFAGKAKRRSLGQSEDFESEDGSEGWDE